MLDSALVLDSALMLNLASPLDPTPSLGPVPAHTLPPGEIRNVVLAASPKHTPLETLRSVLWMVEHGLAACTETRLHLARPGKRKASTAPVRTPWILALPTDTRHGAWQFAVYIRVVQLMVETLASGAVCTKRDVYYRDTRLFRLQAAADQAVEVVAYSLGVASRDVGVVAAQKGLVWGEMTLHAARVRHAFHAAQGSVLIPLFAPPAVIRAAAPPRFVLVVEKEAVFRQCVEYVATAPASLLATGILVTGKGYPDKLTRQFLVLLHDSFPQAPVFAAVDSDVYGVQIAQQYAAAVPVAYLGVHLFSYSAGWCPLSQRDLQVLRCWILRHAPTAPHRYAPMVREVQRGVFALLKLEMDVVGRGGWAVAEHLQHAVSRRLGSGVCAAPDTSQSGST